NDDDDAFWKPLLKDAVTVKKNSGVIDTLVTANVGAGFLAVRHKYDTAIDLEKTPLFQLPVDVSFDSKVNVHMLIDEITYIIQLTAPLAKAKSLLSSEFEQGEQFRIPNLENSFMSSRLLAKHQGDMIRFNLYKRLKQMGHTGDFKLHSITVGNTSNKDYLLAGNGGNNAGSQYGLGRPRFLKSNSE
ncbi:MAG: hypothetical protein HRT89_12590, partial [Lentisphaeria bacterium]|nr:hypothetical protein [Lentisphaeria bacterium]